ncbi:hypothetical protein LMG27174_07145 [Paraburkholderia rhynchosiae]|uniref:Uncharacterized protein n=2 Tax=Paraburkholderia rhynchosiae TaxID=487049 RepID=A0A2N7WD26_9BURK|nr:hypothetical protein C0Z16_25085 [Paraburkholderia rhynchosiae]CAB3744267.1 hypothetical protein LMG27174_07145 [Paraburkholderia rhynchosiae]
MANPVIRTRILEMLRSADFTVVALADRLAVSYNSAAKAIARAREEGEVHVCGYGAYTAAIYRLGAGDDVTRPAPDPVAPDDEQYDAANTRDATVHRVDLPLYFELDGGLLPGVRHFACDRLRATMSVSSCGARWEKANSTDVDADRFHTCRRCSSGAAHAGRVDHNPSQLQGMTICGRCHTGVPRLIGKHLCISCYNRARELRIGKNSKGTAPRKLARLDQRAITYRAGGVVKTRALSETVDTVELIVAVLRDEERTPQFGWHAPAAMDWLLDDDLYDRAIGNTVEVADIAAVADSVQEHTVVPIVASPAADMVVPVPAAIDAVQGHPAADVDPLQVLRDAVAQLEHDAQVCAPTTSRRAPKGQWQQQRREVRVGRVTAGLLRAVGALPPTAVVSVPMTTPFYMADLFAD